MDHDEPLSASLPDRSTEDERGFVLLESVMAIALITVVMTALTTFFISTVSNTAHQRGKQAATQIATSAVEQVRGLGAGGAISGRDSSSVTAQFTSALAARDQVTPWLASMAPAIDLNAPINLGLTAALPTVPVTQMVNGLTYQVSNFVGKCWRPITDTSSDTSCGKAPVAGYVQYVRAVVAVSWPDKSCTNSTCTYLTSTLMNATSEPTFNFNTATPAPPAISCVALTSIAGQPVSRNILASIDPPLTGCTATGVPSFTYADTGLKLKALGLTMAGDGTVTGTPTAAGSASVLVTMTDNFLRTAPATFTWTVSPPLAITALGTQNSIVGTAIAPLTAVAVGGGGAPYTWEASGAPTGLTLNPATGQFTGTPTVAGTYPVVLTATDKSGSKVTSTVTWVVGYGPLSLVTPLAQTSVIGLAIAPLTLTAAGGSGTFAWTDPNKTLPAGLTIDGATVIGTPTATVVKKPVALTMTDAASGKSPLTVNFLWTVNPALTVATINSQTTASYLCGFFVRCYDPLDLKPFVSGGNGIYTYTLVNQTTGILGVDASVSNSVLTPGSTGNSTVTVRVADSAGSPPVTAVFTWRVTL